MGLRAWGVASTAWALVRGGGLDAIRAVGFAGKHWR